MGLDAGLDMGYQRTKREAQTDARKFHPVQEALAVAKKEAAKRVEAAVSRTTGAIGGSVASAATKAAAANVLKTVAKASLVGLAGVAAFYITSKLRTLHYKSYNDLRYDAANEYRQARQRAAAEAGRALTTAELSDLSKWFKARMARLDDAERSGRSVSGVSNLVFGD